MTYETHNFPVPGEWAAKAWCDNDAYLDMYRRSVEDPEGFWGEHGKRIDWSTPYSQVKDVSYAKDDLHIRWFHDGKLNASVNCLDRHLETRGEQTAIIWEGDDPAVDRKISYRELHREVCRFANVLKKVGVRQKGDRVTIYLSMIPELAFAMLACVAHRRRSLDRLRRLLAGFDLPAGSSTADCKLVDHRRRGPARRQADPAEGQPTGGYMVYTSMTHEYVFDYHDGDVYWCTADIGWVTGHSYIVYGPLANGATTLMFEGVPNYPDASALLAGLRQAQGQHLLHRADRDPRADARRRRPGDQDDRASRSGCSARSASRSIPRPGCGTTGWSATSAARSSTPGGRPRPAAS